MYVRRNIDTVLMQWKNTDRRKPVLLRGVRQCGKTSAVRNLSGSFDGYIEINLEKKTELHRLFEGDIDVRRILSRLELEGKQRIVPGKTLLFIDEIQECPRAITALRYFYEEFPELHVIAAGSLLEFVLSKSKATEKVDFPVGRIRSIYMYPFSFTEFLCGTDHEMLCSYLCQLNCSTQSNDAHEELLDLYRTFLIVGGMPEAVAEYVSTGSVFACQQIHRDIIANFADDFGKYSSNIPADIIRKVFLFSAHNICSQVKSSSAVPGVSSYYFNECITLLRRAGLVFPVKPSPCDTLPLGSTEKETNKKLLLFDTGVYLTECGLNVGELLSSEIFNEMNKGNVVEMQTGLEMIKYMNPYQEAALHYWYRTGANAEVDYVMQNGQYIIPVEVKASGKGSMQSMHSFLKTHPASPFGIRVSLENFIIYDNIRVFPVYAVNRIMDSGK